MTRKNGFTVSAHYISWITVLSCIFGISTSAIFLRPALNGPSAIGKYLNGNLPSVSPSTVSGDVSWRVVPAFPNLSFSNPMSMAPDPNSNDLFVGTRDGKVYRFDNNENASSKDLVLNISSKTATVNDGGLLSLICHPDFGDPTSANQHYFYIFYSAKTPGTSNSSTGWLRLSRFTMNPATGVFDPNSELYILNIRRYNNNHRGGDLIFDENGLLYLSIGDQNRQSKTQTMDDNFDGSVIRIDVDMDSTRSHSPKRTIQSVTGNDEESGVNYFIPNDNPFVIEGDSSVLEEYYALGLRQPFRMGRDRITGDIWIGEIGSNKEDEIDILEAGGNYQWAYKEGVDGAGRISKPNSILGDEKTPVISFSRTEASSIIGGTVYRGNQFSPLYGKYICGDYEKDNVFAVSYDPTNQSASRDIIANYGPGSLTCIKEDNQGNLFFMGLGNKSLYKLEASGSLTEEPPALLSQTGAFADMTTLELAEGFIPYEPIQAFYSDNSEKFRAIALPNNGVAFASNEKIGFSEEGEWEFPMGTVFLKHFEMPIDDTQPTLTKRLETRFYVRDENGEYYGITYKWNESGTDADLLVDGQDETITITTANGTREQVWHYPSRTECTACHTDAAGGVLGMKTRHINKDLFYPSSGTTGNQLEALNGIQAFDQALDVNAISTYLTSVALDDTSASLEARVRTYLDINCSNCHRPGTSNRSNMDLRLSTPLAAQNLINAPVLEDLGISGAKVIVPKDPGNSILYRRLDTLDDCCKMAPFSRNTIDENAVEWIGEWINSLEEPVILPPTNATYQAIEDAYVKEWDTGFNGGAIAEIRQKNNGNYSQYSFIKFSTGQLQQVQQATLRLFPTSSSALISIGIYETGSSWSETTITSGNMPSQGNLLDEVSIQNTNNPLELDVSNYAAGILASQTSISFRIHSTQNNKDLGRLHARESGQAAELILTSGTIANQRPTAVIQSNLISGPAPLLVDFDGTGSSDPDGTIDIYAWDFGDGGTNSLAQSSHPYSSPGIYLASLIVTDNDGAKDTAELTITVTEPLANVPPTASFTVDPLIGTVPLLVNLDASASSDSDGSIDVYDWNFGDGNAGTGSPASHTFDSTGTFTIQLIITDDDGAKDTTSQNITVNEQVGPINIPPIASFSADPLTGDVPLVVNLDASLSTDSDGTITSYDWTFGDGNIGNGAATSHTFLAPGIFTVQLLVTDNNGDTDTASLTLTVNDTSPPLATTTYRATEDAYVRLNKGGSNYGSVDFMNLKNNGSYSHESYIKFDVGSPQQVNSALLRLYPASGTELVNIEIFGSSSNWSEGSITANNAPGAQALIATYNMIGPSAAIEVDVSDYVQTVLSNNVDIAFHLASGNSNNDIGQIGTREGGSAAELIIETGSGSGPSNEPPIAEILGAPINGEAPLTVSLDGSGSSDSDGTITSYDWDFGDGNTGNGAITAHEYTEVGTFVVTLTITDDVGAIATATETITVSTPSGNAAPVATFDQDPVSGTVPLTVNFDATASSDSDGSITSYAWTFGDGASGTGAITSHEYTAVGTYVVELTITDEQGTTSTASGTVSVTDVEGPTTSTTLTVVEDAYVKLARANTNYGSAQEIRLKDNGSYSFQGYIKFDAGSTQQVGAATLRLFPKGGTQLIAIDVNATSDGWFENSIVGSNAPLSQGTLGSLTINNENDPLELDVSSYASSVLSSQSTIAFQVISANGNKDIGLLGTKEGALGAELVIQTLVASTSDQVPTTFSSGKPEAGPTLKPSRLSIFPNPFSNHIQLEWNPVEYEFVSVQLQDVRGRILETRLGKGSRGKLVLGKGIPSGMYMLRIKHTKGIMVHKVIKL